VAGAVGSNERFSYSVIGDEVNLAARLESLTRHYPVDVILSESLYAQLDPQTAARCFRIDRVAVKGRISPLDIYALGDFSAEEISHYNAALEKYFKGDFRSALETFRQKQSVLHASMAKRCEELSRATTPWPGHYVWESK
jgi:adenylate cyclase